MLAGEFAELSVISGSSYESFRTYALSFSVCDIKRLHHRGHFKFNPYYIQI